MPTPKERSPGLEHEKGSKVSSFFIIVYIKRSCFYFSSSVLVERETFVQELIEPDPIC